MLLKKWNDGKIAILLKFLQMLDIEMCLEKKEFLLFLDNAFFRSRHQIKLYVDSPNPFSNYEISSLIFG